MSSRKDQFRRNHKDRDLERRNQRRAHPRNFALVVRTGKPVQDPVPLPNRSDRDVA